jgi:YYY domain-containing protein
LLVAAFFRFYGGDFDQKHNQHPDERFIIGKTLAMSWPATWEQFTDVRNSPLNLRRVEGGCPNGCHYAYGSLPVYLTKGVGWLADTYWPGSEQRSPVHFQQTYEGITVIGRMLAALFDLITIVFVFLIGRRLYSGATGLIAAALVAFAVTHIQIAHFYASDVFLVTFMMGALYFSVVLMQRPSWRAAAGFGIFLGLAVASKVSIAPFALVVIAAVALRAVYRKRTRLLGAEFSDPIGVKPATAAERSQSAIGHFLRGLRHVALAAVFAFISFAVTEPYVLPSFDYSLPLIAPGPVEINGETWMEVSPLLNSSPFWGGIKEQTGIQSGRADVPYTRQYVGTTPVVYHLENMVLWGLSPLPGLLVVVGFIVGIWYLLRGRPAEIILMAGAIPYWIPILALEAKWMRYNLPLVPIFAILGAAFLVRGIVSTRALIERRPYLRSGRPVALLRRNLYPALTVLAVGGAFLWSIAFMNIYSQKHSRVQASEWIYDNIPPTITVGGVERQTKRSGESWDDELPLGIAAEDGKPLREGGMYGGSVSFGLYDDRPPDQELEYLKGLMAQTDYIFLASNRIYDSVDNLPWRYPVQIKFYELLFAEKLGFEHLCDNGQAECKHTTQVTPELLGIKFDDQGADESFTVYDHPAVDVFRKTSDLTDEQLRILFSTALNRPGGAYEVARHGQVPDDKSLAYDQPLSTLGNVNDVSWNPLGQPDTQWFAVILWLLAAELLGLIALPIVFTICRRLPDRGYPLAKVVGLLLLAWGIWLAASAKLIPFTVWGILLVLLLLVGLSALCWRLGAGREIRDFASNKRGLIVFYEVVFLATFALFLIIRMMNPDLWHPSLGGEKPMEFGFLNAVLRSPWMPPADPFFAGGYINYYYYGQFVMAVLIKLVGVYPALAVNLAIPLLYAFTFTAGVGIVYNIVAWSQEWRGSRHLVSRSAMTFGVLGGVLMLAIGNMHGLFQLLMIRFPEMTNYLIQWARESGFMEQAMLTPVADFDFWGPSRIIRGTINEFPFWSFLFADFHPHLIDMPFTLAAAGLSLNLAFAGHYLLARPGGGLVNRFKSALGWLWGQGWSGALSFGVLAVILGTLFATNSWDFPTFLGIAGGAVVVALLLGTVRARQVDSSGAEPHKLTRGDKLVMWASGLGSVGVLAGLSLAACMPFLISFKNVLGLEVRPLVDGGLIPNTSEIMHRTTLPEYLVFWAIFVFVALTYLLARLWSFPWQAAFQDVVNLVRRPSSLPSMSRREPALEPEAAFSMPSQGRQLTPAFASAAASGAASQPTTALTYAFSSETQESVEVPVEERAGESSYGTPGGNEAFSPFSTGDDVRATEHSTADLASETSAPTGNGQESHEPVPGWDPKSNSFATELQAQGLPPAATMNWVVDAHAQTELVMPVARPIESPGVIPLWAGLGLLALTAALTGIQLATGQMLLGLLVALLGGIAATTLSSTRSVSALFTGVLLIAAIAVSLGVEMVYLADHLRGGMMYRMNTVFKFYIQVWLLYGAGSAAAIYYIFYGMRDERRTTDDGSVRFTHDKLTTDDGTPEMEVVALSSLIEPTMPHQAVEPLPESNVNPAVTIHDPTDIPHAPDAPFKTGQLKNWLIWTEDDTTPASDGAETGAMPHVGQPPVTPVTVPGAEPAPVGAPLAPPSPPADAPSVQLQQEPVTGEEVTRAGIRWNVWRLLWTGGFAILLAASFIFTIYGTEDRVGERFPSQPPFGTLDGMAYMRYATYGPVSGMGENGQGGSVTIDMKYDHDGIGWLNRNVTGLEVIAEGPYEYYRDGGMRVAANTGLPMITGDLHQGEQRYDWLVGDRNGQSRQLFTTPDPQIALTLLSKYDVSYIYMGQLEQARAGAGLAKFEQMADPKVGILEEVFRSEGPAGIPGTIIYKVSQGDKAPSKLVGAPVQGTTSVPGISFTPLPTPTPEPPPTPPTDNPELQGLLQAVEADPTSFEARMRLIEWYRANEFPVAAAEHLTILIKQSPRDVAIRHMLGDSYQAAGRTQEALTAWEEAVEVDPNNPAAYNKVGVAYLERRMYDQAIEAFRQTVEKDPAFIEGYLHLGEAFEAKGDRQSARDAYQRAVDNKKTPDDPWAKEAQERLNRIK